MKLPSQSQAVRRQARDAFGGAASGLLTSACGAANVGQGQCFTDDGPIGGPTAFNCQACCALRAANHWQGQNGTFAICT